MMERKNVKDLDSLIQFLEDILEKPKNATLTNCERCGLINNNQCRMCTNCELIFLNFIESVSGLSKYDIIQAILQNPSLACHQFLKAATYRRNTIYLCVKKKNNSISMTYTSFISLPDLVEVLKTFQKTDVKVYEE